MKRVFNKNMTTRKITLSLPITVERELRRRAKIKGVVGALSMITSDALKLYFEKYPEKKDG